MYRRRFVTTTAGTALTVCLAGCLGGDDSGSGDDDGTSNDDSGNTSDDSSDPGNSNQNNTVDDSSDPGNGNQNNTGGDSGDSGDSQPEETTAEFTWQPPEPTVQTPVDFIASASTGDIAQYRWDFNGDGNIESMTSVDIQTHTFDETGDMPVTLEVETSDGEIATSTEEVPVGGVAAAFTVNPPSPVADRTATLVATDSTGDIAEYRWDFDDDGSFDQTTEEPTVEQVFEEAGVRTVTLEVEGAGGQTDTDSLEISVNETSDRLIATVDLQPEEPVVGEEVTFDATDSLGGIVEYRWDFDGDGTVDATTEDPVVTHAYDQPYDEAGPAAVTLEIEDSDGETDVTSIELYVREERDIPAPEADFDWVPSGVLEGEEVTFQAFSVTGDIVEFRWDFDDDGTFEEIANTVTTTHTFTDITGEAEKPVTLEIEDSQGRTDAVTYEVPIEERPGPQAALDSTPSDPNPGEETTLDASASTGDIVEYRWDLDGDGTVEETTEEPTTTHVFEEVGTVTVTLEVEGPGGEMDTTSLDVPVSDTAELDPAFEWEPPEPAVGGEVTFDATESTGNILEYRWDFDGDGTIEAVTDIPEITHVFEESGTVTVALELQSEGGETAQTTRDVPVSE